MRRQKFSKRTLRLILAGNLCVCVSLLASTHSNIGRFITDFLSGFGVALILGGFFLEVRRKKAVAKDSNSTGC